MATGYQDNILATVTANVLLPKVMLEFCNCEKPKGRKDVLTTLEREKAPFRPIIRDNDSGMNDVDSPLVEIKDVPEISNCIRTILDQEKE